MRFSLAALLLLTPFALQAQKFVYPVAERANTQDIFFENTSIKDEFRWLEDTKSPKVKKWISEQNSITFPYLKKLQNKHNTFLTIDKLAYYKASHPRKEGKYYFSRAYYHNQSTPALFYRSSINVAPTLLVDPNLIDTQAKIEIKDYSVSKDSKYLAFQYNRNGTDWAELQVVSLANGVWKKDHLKNLKFSNIAWKGDGFYYSTYPKTDDFGKTEGQKVFYHKLGTEQKDDVLIFERNNPQLRFRYLTSSDEQFFVLKEVNEQAGKISLFYINFQEEKAQLKPLLLNLKFDVDVLNSNNGKLIATTFKDNTGSILEIDPANPLKWKAIASKFSKAVLVEAIPLKDKIIAIYQSNQHPILTVLDYSGNVNYTHEFPVGTSISGFAGNSYDEEFLYHLTSYTFPPIVYSFNVKTYERKLTDQTRANFTVEDLELNEIEATAKDGTKIPILIVHKKGVSLNGQNPTILSAYGGFGAIAQPSFDPGIVYFVKQGGVYAFANIRGGGDLGADWAWKGKGANKQISFHDFIAAAVDLIKSGYTQPAKLATMGASNGGLVVAASAIQRPDLFKAVVPMVAPLDMLRFEQFTVGQFHRDEYGTVSDPESFKDLKAYSPLHNVQENTDYPAMLILTSENDDRVPPFHSYKFVAALQNRSAQKNPILLRVEQDAGHQGGATIYTNIQEKANIFAFIWEMLNKES